MINPILQITENNSTVKSQLRKEIDNLSFIVGFTRLLIF